MKTIQLTETKFKSIVGDYETGLDGFKYLGEKPAIIDFYTDWCGPCKALAPILDELAAEYGEQLYIYKIDAEEESDLAVAFNIRSIPSLLFIPLDGQPQMFQGTMPKATLKNAIDEILLKEQYLYSM